jgi:hypothetical protein
MASVKPEASRWQQANLKDSPRVMQLVSVSAFERPHLLHECVEAVEPKY